mmetsp:Transcript_133796/g.286141  ORF Transcript_133796/g.286141 Transcript_133796/m.286141 type:complete len:223 (-) Transcript_133796:342-1010(-)
MRTRTISPTSASSKMFISFTSSLISFFRILPCCGSPPFGGFMTTKIPPTVTPLTTASSHSSLGTSTKPERSIGGRRLRSSLPSCLTFRTQTSTSSNFSTNLEARLARPWPALERCTKPSFAVPTSTKMPFGTTLVTFPRSFWPFFKSSAKMVGCLMPTRDSPLVRICTSHLTPPLRDLISSFLCLCLCSLGCGGCCACSPSRFSSPCGVHGSSSSSMTGISS